MLAMVARSTTGNAAAPGAKEFDKFPDHFGLAQHLRDGQREVGRGDTFLQRAGQMHAHDIRRQEINRLPEHARFGFDAADAPADNAQAVDHRRVRIGADERVGIVNAVLVSTERLWRDIPD